MSYTFELNNERRTMPVQATKLITEVFSAMVNGKEVGTLGKKADEAVTYIKNLGTKAQAGDLMAVNELNALRQFVVKPLLSEEAKVLSLFGNYKELKMNESAEIEIFDHIGVEANRQAPRTDVTFPYVKKTKQPVALQTISAGYAVDYRQMALGDMTLENEGMGQVRIQMRNNLTQYVIQTIYKAISDSTGIKYMVDDAGLTKTNIDTVLKKIRRYGKANVIGTYGLLTQFTPWAGYVGNINSNTVTGISEKAMNEIAQDGILSLYNGCILKEMPNPYNEYEMTEDGTNFETMLPAGLGFVVPTGVKSPIATYTRGGLTSFTGNNIKTGKIETRFDLEVGCDVAKGQEHRIGTIYDSNIGGLD